MPIKRTQPENVQTYFCTFTCLHWLDLFSITNLYHEIYKWFNILLERQNEIEGFVIMPNHVHRLIFAFNERQNINKQLANGKRFLAYEIIKRLEQSNQTDILKKLEMAVTEQEKARNKNIVYLRYPPTSNLVTQKNFCCKSLAICTITHCRENGN